MMMSRIEGRPLLGRRSMLVSGVGEETLQVPGEVGTERTTLSVLVFAAFASLPGKQLQWCWQLVALLSEKQGI